MRCLLEGGSYLETQNTVPHFDASQIQILLFKGTGVQLHTLTATLYVVHNIKTSCVVFILAKVARLRTSAIMEWGNRQGESPYFMLKSAIIMTFDYEKCDFKC